MLLNTLNNIFFIFVIIDIIKKDKCKILQDKYVGISNM